VVGGRVFAQVYRPYFFRGVRYDIYAPTFYYHPAYYGWAYNPWPAPVVFMWGPPAPWYAYYGFAPAPVYPSASLWLTDFLLAANLKVANDARNEDGLPPPQGAGEITPEVRQQIADEVKQQLGAEQAAATNPQQPAGNNEYGSVAPPALDPAQRNFVVSSPLSVTNVDGQECALTPGDVIIRLSTTPDQNNAVLTQVSYSKPEDCKIPSVVPVSVTDLQEMRNSSQEQIDLGLKVLADNQGKHGLPPVADSGTIPGAPAPVPDAAYAEKQMEQQQKDADQAESKLQQEAVATQGSPGAI
jgi:hypothetical protein